MRVVDGWLVSGEGDSPVLQVRSPKHGALSSPAPIAAVWHWTGWLGMDAAEYCRRAAASSREASWHVLIARDGRVIQGVPFTRAAWHVGRKGLIGGREVSINGTTVGIELENAGRLKKVGGAWRYYVGDGRWEGNIPEAEVVHVPGEGVFHGFTGPQIATAAQVLAALVDEYGWEPEVCGYGHIDFAKPGTKDDPGPVWGCQRWPDGPVLREVLEIALGAPGGPVGLPTFCDDASETPACEVDG